MEQPVWFIPVRLWYVAVEGLFPEGIGFFTEQVSEHLLDQPYRSRVLQLLDEPLRLENYRLKDQPAWAGAALATERLLKLTPQDLDFLPGCTILLEKHSESYLGRMQPGGGCRLSSQDTAYVEIELELRADRFITLDRGFDSTTGTQTWGSRAGAYQYLKLP